METGVVIIQEPEFTKTSAEEAPPGVVLDHPTMEVDKVNLSTALDDCRNSITQDVAEDLNGSGNKETEELKHEKEEAMKTTSVVEDNKIVKEIANETETDEQGTTFVHEPESFNKNTNDANIILSDVTLEKEKEDDTTQNLEEVVFQKPVTEEDQTETKDSQEQEKEISKVLVPVKSSEDDMEKILDSAREEIPIKTDEEKDSRSVENSVNETETEHNATVSVEEISRNGENIVKERALEEEASTDGVSLHDLETTKEAEPRLDTKEKDETETEIVINEETTVNESVSLKENAEPVEASVRDIPQDETLIPKAEIVNTLDTTSDETDAEPSLDLKEEEETVTSSDEVQERVTMIEPPKTSTDQTFKDTEEDEHVLARNMPQAESLVTNEDTESIIDLKEDKEQNKTEKSEEIPSDLALKVDKEELKEDKLKVDQVVGAQTMEEQRDLEVNESEAEPVDRNRTDETEVSQVEKLVAHPDVKSVEQMEKPSLESPSQVSEEKIKNLDEKIEEKTEEGEPPHQESQEEGAYGTETKEEEKLVDHPDVISVEHMEKPSVESPSQVSEEKSRNLDEKIEEKPEEGEPPHQESQEEGSYGTETKEEVVSVTESSELGEPIEQDKEKNLQKDQIHKHEPANEEVKSDEVINFSSASASEEREGETVVKAKKIEERKANEEDQIQPSIETVETVDTEPVKSNEDDIEESSSSTREEIQIKSKDVQIDEEKASTTAETFVNGTEHEHNATNSVEGILKNIVNETALEEDRQGEHEEPVEAIKNSDDAEKISHGMTGDREKEEDITWKTEEVQESSTVIETPTLEEEHIESKASKDTEEHEHVLMPQIDTLVTEAEDANTSTVQEAAILKTLETTSNETEVGQETIKDRELSLDLKEDKEKEETETAKTVIASDEERPPNQVDVQAEESVEVKSKETVQVKSNEEKKHENLLDNEPESVLVAKTESQDKFEDIPSDLVLEVDKEELKDDKTEVNKVDGIQVMGKQRGLELNEPEAEHIDRNKSDEGAETIVENLVVKSDERMQSSSLECPSEVSTPVDEKIEEKLQEEVTLPQEGQEIKEDTLLVPESKDLGEKSQEEVSSLPKETKLQQEHIEKCEPTNEVPNDQKSPVEEKSDEVIQVSSEEREGGIIVKLEDIKANEEEKIQKSLGPLDIAEPQSLLSSYSEEQEHETVSEKIEDERVKEEEPIVQILSEGDATESHERQDEIHKTGETAAVQEEKTRDIGSSLNEKCSVDQTKTEEQANEHVDSQTWLVFSEKSDGETLTAETVRDMPPQGETIVTVAEAVDTSTVQEVAVLNTLETNINEPEAVHRPIVGEEESQVTKEDTEPRMELKADKEQEERETVIFSNEVITDESQGREESVEVKPKEKDENLLDVPYEESAEKMQSTSLESPCEQSEETSKTVDEKIEEIPQAEVTLHKEIQETKEETVPVPGVQAKEEESCPPNEQEKETTLQKEQIEKHESTSEEDTTAHQIPVEEKSDEVSSASPSGETVVEAEKIEDIKENEEEQVEDKIQRSLEAVETVEPHSSFPSPPEEHETVAEAEKIEDGKVKETEPMEDMSEKDLEISETKDMSPPFEASGLDGTESSELVGGFEEQKPKQVKEILEGDETKFHSSETIPQEPVSDVVAVQLKIEDNAAVGHERREELSNDVEMEETTVAQEEQTRDIGFSMDQTQPEEQVNESIGEQEKVSSTEKEETKTKEFEEENLDKHVDSSENNDDETLVAETKKEDEVITVSLDGSITSKTSENECIKQEEFENIKAPNPEESKDDKSQEVSETIDAKGDHTLAIEANQTPSFVSELEDKIPKQIEDIHEEETKEARVLVDQSLPVEETEDIQIPSLVSEQEDQASKEIQEIHEEDTNAHQIPVEEKSDEVIQVSSASASGETVVEAEKFEDIKENEEEQVEDKIQRSLEAVETVEPHSSFPSPPEEHDTVADAEKIEDGKVKETDPMGDMNEKDLEISETKDMSPPFEASGLDGTESYELVAAFEEQKTKQVKEILEGDETKTEKVPSSETIPQETLFESLEAPKQEESKEDKSQEVSETIEAKGDHTLDIEANQTPSFSSELEEKFPKQIEDIREEETKEARVLVDQSLPIEVSQEKQIPSLVSEQEEHNSKQVQEIHEEETNVSHKVEATSGRNLPVEASQAHQTPSSELVSGLDDKTSKEVEEIHDEETKGHKLQEEEIIPTEIVPRESFSESPASMLASGEDDQGTVQERNFAGETQEEKHGSEEKEESLGETKPKESEVERKEKSGDQIETSTKVTKVEDEDTKERDTEVAEITEGQSLSHAPENVCLEQEELKDIGTLKPGAITEDQDSLKNDNSDDFTFSTETGEAEHGDETSSTLPVVGILKELRTTLGRERAINDSEVGSSGNDFHSIKEEPQPLEKNLVPDISEPVTYEKQDEKVVEESPSSEIIEANMLLQDESGETEKIQEERGLAGRYHPIEEIKLQEEHKEEGKVQDNKNREFEVDVEERLQEEAREIAECKEETPASLSLTELVPTENILTPSSDFPLEEPKKEDGKAQEVVKASALEKISLQEDHSRDFETEQNIEAHETAKEEDQIVDIKEEKKNEELQVEKLSGLSARRDTEETFSSEVKKDQEDASELEVEHGSPTLQVKKEEESHSVLGNDQKINEVVTSEKKITDPIDVIKNSEEAEHASNDEHIETQEISDDSKSYNDRDFPTEEAPEDVNADESLTKEALEVQDQPKDFEAPVTYEDTTEQENELTYVQEDIGTNVKPEVAAQNEESGLIKEKNEVDYLKTEPEDAIKPGVSIEEKNDMLEKTGQEATKEIYQDGSKQTDTVTAINEVIKEEEKETTEECFNSMKNTDDVTEQTKPEIRETDKLSSVSDTQDKSTKQEDEVLNQEKREIADEVPKLENVKISEELQKKDGESESNKESEPTVKETARKSLSDLIQKGKGTDKTEVATTEPRIEEEPKTEEEDEDGDEHKDDKTSPDSIVMVESKDTVSIIKTQKKSQGILSGVGSKVKHSISKVKKAFTGKSSHTTKPSSPQ